MAELVEHHEQRLERTLAACATPATAAEVLQSLFRRPLDPHQTGFALAETLAHLNYLLNRGELGRWVSEAGVLLYQAR